MKFCLRKRYFSLLLTTTFELIASTCSTLCRFRESQLAALSADSTPSLPVRPLPLLSAPTAGPLTPHSQGFLHYCSKKNKTYITRKINLCIVLHSARVELSPFSLPHTLSISLYLYRSLFSPPSLGLGRDRVICKNPRVRQ